MLQNMVDEISILIFAIPILLALPSLVNKFSVGDYLFYLILSTWLLANYAFFPDNTNYLDEEVLLCIFCVFPYYFIGRILEIDDNYNLLLYSSLACVFINVYYYFVYAQNFRNIKDIASDDNMYAAYQVMPHVAFLLWSALERFRIWKVVMVLLGIVFLLSCGTRGPLVCMAFFGVVYFLFFMKFKGAAYIRTFIIILSLVVFLNLKEIVIYLVKVFTDLKLSTRILEKFITGEMSNDSYRSVLRDKLYEVLDGGDNFFGLGAFGCRNYDIIYPHYLPLDFACTFGYVIGYSLLAFIVILVIYAIWVAPTGRTQEFIVFLFSLSIVKLFLSNSFILEPYFFFLIGACVKVIMDSRQEEVSIQCSHE